MSLPCRLKWAHRVPCIGVENGSRIECSRVWHHALGRLQNTSSIRTERFHFRRREHQWLLCTETLPNLNANFTNGVYCGETQRFSKTLFSNILYLPAWYKSNELPNLSCTFNYDWLNRLRKSKIINPCSSSPKQKAQKQWKEWRDGKENKKFRYARLPFIKTENKTVLQSCGTERTLQLLHEYMDAYSLTNFRGKTPLNNDLTKLSAITNLGAILVS